MNYVYIVMAKHAYDSDYICAVFEGSDAGYVKARDYAQESNDLGEDDYYYVVDQWEVR